MKVLDKGRLHISAVCTAVAERMLADALYYASGGYYVGLTLYQMWPVDVGTVEQWTLVEQLVSVLGTAGATGGYLRGPNYYWY